MDGQTIRGTNLYLGMEWPTNPTTPGAKKEIYVLGDNDTFRFNRYAVAFNPRASMPDVLAELTPIMVKLSQVLAEMDAVYAKYGGPPGDGGTIVGNWRIKHKDA